MARLVRLLLQRMPARLVALSGLLLGTVGSCTLPTIKPPSL
jgi:hypothetical protein